MAKKSDKNKNLGTIKLKNFFKNNSVLIIIFGLIVVMGFLVYISAGNQQKEANKIYGDDVIEMHYFFQRTCKFCQLQKQFHPELQMKYPNLKIIEHDFAKATDRDYYKTFLDKIEGLPQNPGTPLTIIGDRYNEGFGSPETSGAVLFSMIEEEQMKIEENWDNETMKRTVDLN
jgi:hypothetical protein